jgi:hypothetical protein
MRIALVAATLAAVLVPTAWGANPPSSSAFTTCLKNHGVVLGKTTDQKKISAAFKACRASNPGGTRPQLTAAQRAAFQKYAACLARHGVKLQRPTGQRASTRPNPTAKQLAAEKACASLRPKFGPRPAATS